MDSSPCRRFRRHNPPIGHTTRFAPSPTGLLHLGHAYAAWFAHQCARPDGRFLLRIEDIDTARSRKEYILAIFEDLEWLGVPYTGQVRFQSEHFSIYQSAVDRLGDLGLTYPCFCSRKDIESATDAPHGATPHHYPGTCRGLDPDRAADRIAKGEPYALRVDTEKALRQAGPLSFIESGLLRNVDYGALDDFVVARKEIPTSYHLSVVLDDAAQGVTLVTRGKDLLESVAPQRLLQSLLDLPQPEYRHHSLVCDESGKRLAKRSGSVSIRQLRESGLTPGQVYGLALERLCQS